MKIDLHIHTTYSDGMLSPTQIVDTAVECGLDVIAITDHDNVLSHKIAQDYAKNKNINLEIISGVEINTIYKGYEVHILGYFMDKENKAFVDMINYQQKARIEQTHQIIDLLNKNCVSVVGTRRATKYGREVTKSLTSQFASSGIVVVSGLADGVDTIAHQTCVELNKPTIAVLGCGINTIYPSNNINLAKNIIEKSGLIISEYQPNEEAVL